ncbi:MULTISPECIES: hypothetical protein [unclassified Mesorhizobium]|uniref:hypothetical protein n=1 Tax=unclassified Mesorhizobium TaxID=325217 RepID=UPI001FDF077E|nr:MULTISPECIES: hypothetical protein [unclassified Mesorhizobium]
MVEERATYSLVVEMENAKSIDWDEIGVGMKALAREISSVSATGSAHTFHTTTSFQEPLR